MAKPTKSQKIKARKTREFSEREANRNAKIISKVFIEFANQFEQDNKQYFADTASYKILYNKFYKALKTALFQIYSSSSQNAGKFINTLYGWRLENEIIKNITNDVVDNWNKKYSAKKVKNITKTTEQRINNIITRGQKAGLNNKDIAKEIKNGIIGMSKARAKTIARTETKNSIETTSNAVANEAGITGKTWIHTSASKVPRENHLVLDGIKKKFDEYFDLGNELAKFPHAPNLSAENVINCSCICVYE